MLPSSEYPFPIFISSTDYNLKDFRAELSRFLKDLGYKPILSSADGFPDNSPKLQPWESCIPVLDKSFVMILVIDGRYSTALEWPNLKNIFGDRKVSPTHGEYLFAHNQHKRMLVFIRKEVVTFYQSYRKLCKELKGVDESEIKKILDKILPDYIDYETLKFVHEVKTTTPIPWINEFNDITEVKEQVQKKMLNELAEIFLIKERNLEVMIDSFNKLLATLQPDERISVLKKMDATKEVIEAAEKFELKVKELEDAKTELEKAKAAQAQDIKQNEERVEKLTREIENYKKVSYNPDFIFQSGSTLYLGQTKSGSTPSFYKPHHGTFWNLLNAVRKCDKCGESKPSELDLIQTAYFNECPNCHRQICLACWPKPITLFDASPLLCPDCEALKKLD